MVGYTRKAEAQLDALRQYYVDLERLEALLNLEAALDEAEEKIEHTPAAGIPAPRPYPFLALEGRRWLKVGPYWVAYSTTKPPVIIGIFHERVDIPGRYLD